MNAHDSERIKGMLEELGLGEAVTQDEADVLVFVEGMIYLGGFPDALRFVHLYAHAVG